MKNYEARKKLRVLQALSPKEMAAAAVIIKALDKVPKKKRADILLKAYNQLNSQP